MAKPFRLSVSNSSSKLRTIPCPYWHTGQVGEKTDTILTDRLARLNSSLSLSIFSVSIPFHLLLPPIKRGSIRIVYPVHPLLLRRGALFLPVLVSVK